MSLQIPHGTEREYIAILGIAAVYVASLPHDGGLIGVARDLELAGNSLQRRFPGAGIMMFGTWVKDRSTAEAIRREANAIALPSGSPFRLQAAIEVAAHRLDIVTTEHSVVMARVAAVVRNIEEQIERASRDGELQWFNRAYKQWRLQEQARGRIMTYGDARAKLRRAVIEQGLSKVRQGELLPSIFPDLRQSKFNFH